MNEAARARLQHGLAARQRHDMEAALSAIADAATLAPDDAGIAFAHAQISFETWRTAVPLYSRAYGLDPSNLQLSRALALAMAAEGRADEGEALLASRLAINPDWVEGHQALTSLRVTAGHGADATQSFADACKARPDNMALRLAWFHIMATARNWDAARTIIADGVAHLGQTRALTVAQIFLASESDEASRDLRLFNPVADMNDPGLDLCQTRFWLRNGQPDKAETIAARHVSTPAARTFWPYLSLAWRLQEDERANWLDGGARYIRPFDLDIPASQLQALADTLRTLHTLKAPYLEQSVRGGTQTDRHLFFNPDPAIQNIKQRLSKAVDTYVADLPLQEEGHPLLGTKRTGIIYEGSWSVRLMAQGFHSIHTHNRGWLSSALYVALPAPCKMGVEPAGWISFGAPPPELRLSLTACQQVEPKAGRLVLFPSTTWHGTMPFDDGERLTIAFDVRLPM